MGTLKTAKPDTAPAYFSTKAKGLWATINGEFELEADAVETLRVALENLDLADAARKLLRDEGLVVGGKKHPASDAVKLHDGLCPRALRALNLEIVAPGPIGRPAGGAKFGRKV